MNNNIIVKKDHIVIRKHSIWRKLYQQKYLYIMLLPAFALILLFAYQPLVYSYIAFSEYKLGFGVFDGAWVGLSHFKEFFVDTVDAANIFYNTLFINIMSLFVNLSAAMFFAIMINEVNRPVLRRAVQTLSIFPFFISWVVSFGIFQVFLSVNTGVLNRILMNIGVVEEGINFLGNPKYSHRLMVAANLWKSIGYNAIIFLASIASIEQEQYEAANIDGASRTQKIRHITIPALSRTIAVLLILNMGGLLSTDFTQYYQFTNPTNRPRMEVFDMYVYRFGMRLARFSYATAVGLLKSMISVILISTANIVNKRITNNSIF